MKPNETLPLGNRLVYTACMVRQTLSHRQQQVLRFIKQYTAQSQQSPSLAEIATDIGVTTKATVAEHLSALEKKGYIRRIPGAFRGIVLTREDEGTVELPLVSVPLMGHVAAGMPISTEGADQTVVNVARKLVPHKNRQYFALEVQGDSMQEDGIYDGEVIIVEARSHADNGDLVVAADEHDNVTLKYFYKERNRVRLEPRNPKYQPLYPKHCTILGLFRGITTKQEVWQEG